MGKMKNVPFRVFCYVRVTRGMFVFKGQYSNDWTLTAAGILIVAAPLISAYIFGQRYIVDGIMAGGVKA